MTYSPTHHFLKFWGGTQNNHTLRVQCVCHVREGQDKRGISRRGQNGRVNLFREMIRISVVTTTVSRDKEIQVYGCEGVTNRYLLSQN